MKKVIWLSVGLILAGAAVVLFAHDWILKTGMANAVTRITGFQTKVHTLKYDFPSTIRIQDMEMLNPPGFNEKVFTRIPEMYATFFIGEFIRGKGVHFGEIRLDIQEVHIEKNAKGVLNVALLTPVEEAGDRRKPVQPGKLTSFLLESFEFSLRDVSYQNQSGIYGSSGLPNKLSVDMNIQNRIYKDIHDPQVLVNLILAEIIRKETFGRLLGLNLKDLLGENLYGVLNSGQVFIGEQAGAITHQVGSLLNDSVHGTGGILNGAGSAAGETVSGLWGKLKSLMPGEKTPAA
ncbi:MAG: hypothetical protein COV74_02145 [Candidatus Omnitrophica bacterium CG11_big_fil_rev_8_21_14_0_20_45_26]|uniref:AsmA domain-containing protein n=1 Tax=Candidatus Abzuiibacterium crystallinum TaxID=1974748 RepID=A0A2H0LRW4_9BACT|nr:MAG: hypothetical protein COV74_02145 [Candidatus Omnitrophica bacterium CG11_big_fil_rev_8_21_14_0_20_45_26]PIW64882.1 MAG: hypothetical protein COW12_04385 [Candidatus Omnitrophica bacterium CG12_big_fil_rev_8_21_14_0_65_45_16]